MNLHSSKQIGEVRGKSETLGDLAEERSGELSITTFVGLSTCDLIRAEE